MEIRSLRYAVTLADELHFGRAARSLFISAQPFGRHIQQLEREVGCQLFERTSRRVRVTPAGERFVADARRVLAAVDALAEAARFEAPADLAVVSVGVLGFGLAEGWCFLLETVSAQVPGIEVRYDDLDLVSQYDAVRLGYVDVGIVQNTGPVDGLAFDPLIAIPRVAVVPARSAYADADALTTADVADAPWISMAECHPVMAAWAGAAAQAGRGVPVRSPAAIPAAVATTGRLALHGEAASRYYPRPDVRFISLDGPPCEVALATRCGDDRPAVQAFRRAARIFSLVTAADRNFPG
jgi:DNA-binding transcriptional LysR family regulator